MALFKARARALDMLGRQQIAGIPTAISELFKNAHDAYARRVEADLYRPEKTFTLRDDGLGMTEEDFTERWLTLGTDSKLGAKFGLTAPPVDEDQETRPIMGEKGVGRLAIATLGPQVLILTRAKRDAELGDLVAAFISWQIFECPGLELSDVQVPLKSFKGGTLPTKAQIDELVKESIENVKALEKKLDPERAQQLLRRLRAFDVDPKSYFSKDFTLTGSSHGTAFIIQPVDENLRLELEDTKKAGDKKKIGISPLAKMLIGFSNTLTTEEDDEPLMRVEFYDRHSADQIESLIGDSEFFTAADFAEADHRIIGDFDSNGNFKGTVAVYDNAPKRYELEWSEGDGKPTVCGPFRLRFAYLQGLVHESRLDPERYAYLERKLDKVAGLYIYRDGIRVLPYGNSDFDFLDIELRRSKNAAHYFFSYRRMFGAIEITRKKNPELEEKAGREGFRLNRAYREFRSILELFLVQLAADFFREGGEKAKAWEARKAELQNREKTRKAREQESKRVRNEVQLRLGELLEKFTDREPQERVKALLDEAKRQFKTAAERSSREGTERHVVDAESNVRAQLEQLRNGYVFERPKGFALDERLQEVWEEYRTYLADLETKTFKPAHAQLDKAAKDAADAAKVFIDQRQRAERALQDKVRSARKSVGGLNEEISMVGQALLSRSTALARQAVDAVEKVVAAELAAFTKDGKLQPSAFAELRDAALERIEVCAETQLRSLAEVRDQLRAVDLDAEPGAITNRFALTEALEEELIATRARAEEAFNIAQLGMAVEVINHEFAASIRGVRQSLGRLRTWADANEKLRSVYNDLTSSFEHLDGYLSLFAPLSRRVTRRKIEIKGSDIAEYLSDLFEERMKRHEIELHASKTFEAMRLEGYPSTFYPVFVNLVDNAMYWLSVAKRGPRTIELDYKRGVITVADSGLGISAKDRDQVFERGFSKKPGGQGLGLYIARSVLERNGYLLEVSKDEREKGAAFEIRPVGDQ